MVSTVMQGRHGVAYAFAGVVENVEGHEAQEVDAADEDEGEEHVPLGNGKGGGRYESDVAILLDQSHIRFLLGLCFCRGGPRARCGSATLNP